MAGSWGVHWGEGGLFRIRRGTNECEIEDEVAAGIPLLEEGQRLVGGGGDYVVVVLLVNDFKIKE